jgi:hypothetical protein
MLMGIALFVLKLSPSAQPHRSIRPKNNKRKKPIKLYRNTLLSVTVTPTETPKDYEFSGVTQQFRLFNKFYR